VPQGLAEQLECFDLKTSHITKLQTAQRRIRCRREGGRGIPRWYQDIGLLGFSSSPKMGQVYRSPSRSISSAAANTRRGRPFLRRESGRSTRTPASRRRTNASCAV